MPEREALSRLSAWTDQVGESGRIVSKGRGHRYRGCDPPDCLTVPGRFSPPIDLSDNRSRRVSVPVPPCDGRNRSTPLWPFEGRAKLSDGEARASSLTTQSISLPEGYHGEARTRSECVRRPPDWTLLVETPRSHQRTRPTRSVMKLFTRSSTSDPQQRAHRKKAFFIRDRSYDTGGAWVRRSGAALFVFDAAREQLGRSMINPRSHNQQKGARAPHPSSARLQSAVGAKGHATL